MSCPEGSGYKGNMRFESPFPLWILILSLWLLLPGALTAQEGESPDTNSGEARPPLPGETAVPVDPAGMNVELNLPSEGRESSEATPPGYSFDNPEVKERWLSRKELLANRNGVMGETEGYWIGPLARESEGSDSSSVLRREALELLREWGQALSGGTLREELIFARYRASLTVLISEQLRRGGAPSALRVGRIQLTLSGEDPALPAETEKARARVNLRFFSDRGTDAMGEVFLVRDQQRWWVEDWQIDLGALQEEKNNMANKELNDEVELYQPF